VTLFPIFIAVPYVKLMSWCMCSLQALQLQQNQFLYRCITTYVLSNPIFCYWRSWCGNARRNSTTGSVAGLYL